MNYFFVHLLSSSKPPLISLCSFFSLIEQTFLIIKFLNIIPDWLYCFLFILYTKHCNTCWKFFSLFTREMIFHTYTLPFDTAFHLMLVINLFKSAFPHYLNSRFFGNNFILLEFIIYIIVILVFLLKCETLIFK